MKVNPLAILLIAIATIVGYVFFGSWLIGLLVGLVIILIASLLPASKL